MNMSSAVPLVTLDVCGASVWLGLEGVETDSTSLAAAEALNSFE
jgi:hypothetical protein